VTGPSFDQKIRNVPAGTSWAGCSVRELSVLVGTFVLVRGLFLLGRAGIASSKIHNGPGVVPGRYAGEAIPIHSGPTPEQLAFQQHKTNADGLAGRICAAAAETARSISLLLELVGEFDAIGGMTHWTVSNPWLIGCSGRVR
jgi:hypothetical protein